MPTYVYHCNSCNKTFEANQRMSDKALTTCTCGKEGQVERQLSAGSGVIFKGTGFYQTDYKGGNASGASKMESKTESKPEPKSDSTAGSTSSTGSSE